MTQERPIKGVNGWLVIALNIGILYAIITQILKGWHLLLSEPTGLLVNMLLSPAGLIILFLFIGSGFFMLQPNQGAVLTLFGKYMGTVKNDGLLWTIPLFVRRTVSLRSNTLNGEKLKVNDKNGNPVEIAVIVVWHVKNTAQAIFDVENYHQFVTIQCESATRHLASIYSYDHPEEGGISLRGSTEEVSKALEKELQARVEKAGVVIEEARLSHLAYAPEIASAMLRRQQAQAIIEARQKIVTGAVSMVEMALNELAERKVLQLDDERKAVMVSNLLVVLCGDSEAQPIINTGTLYT